MVTNSWHLNGVDTVSVDIIALVLRGSLQSDVSSINTSNYTREPFAEGERIFLLFVNDHLIKRRCFDIRA